MKCPKCGKDVGDSKFCPYCGTEIEENSRSQVENVENKFEIQKSEIQGSKNNSNFKDHKKSKTLTIVAVSIVAVFLIGIIGISGNTGKSKKLSSSNSSNTLKTCKSRSIEYQIPKNWKEDNSKAKDGVTTYKTPSNEFVFFSCGNDTLQNIHSAVQSDFKEKAKSQGKYINSLTLSGMKNSCMYWYPETQSNGEKVCTTMALFHFSNDDFLNVSTKTFGSDDSEAMTLYNQIKLTYQPSTTLSSNLNSSPDISDKEFPSTYHFDSPPDYSSDSSNSEVVSSETSSQKALMRNAFIGDCKSIDYKSIARNPQKYVGKAVKFKGQVQQVIDIDSKREALMVYVDPDEYGNYQNPIYVIHQKNNESRILEKDIITIYGTVSQLETYTTVMGDEKTIPGMLADYIVVNSK